MIQDEPSPGTTSGKTNWVSGEVLVLVNYLHEHHVEQGDASNFKLSTYALAALAIAPFHKIGPIRTGPMCKMKWTALKWIYNAIETYHGWSGFHWDHDHGGKIEGEAAQAVWNEYISRKACHTSIKYGNDVLRPFHKNGWEFYEQIHDIFPSGGTQGAN
ncbi:hypothetical protein PAXRUDRAFT_158287, partial [Paxillus rubicundulus Ve08.2h10]